MGIEINKILSEKSLKKLSSEDIKNIQESFDKEYSLKVDELENNISNKFESLVEKFTDKFDKQVNSVITVESVKGSVGKTINEKMYGLVKDMVNLMENAGITTTEKTKELESKLKDANDKLVKSWGEREAIKSQLSDAEKEKYILNQTKGMNPKVINAALEFFKDKELLDVQDELQSFIDGDFDNLELEKRDDKSFSGELDIDQVQDALDEIDDKNKDSDFLKKQTKFESLGKGLSNKKYINKGPNVSKESMDSMSKAITESENGVEEEDTREAMNQIEDYNSLGYNFREKI